VPPPTPIGERIRRGECLYCGEPLEQARDLHDPADVLTHICAWCQCARRGPGVHRLVDDTEPLFSAERDNREPEVEA